MEQIMIIITQSKIWDYRSGNHEDPTKRSG
jgi:hypothetical protein